MPAEQVVPHQAPRQADVPRGQAAGAVGGGVFLAQAGVQAERRAGGQALCQRRVQRVQPLDDDDAAAAVHRLGAVGQLQLEIKHRGLADAFRMQLRQALLQQRHIQRLQTLVIVAAVVVFGVAPLAHKKVVQAEHHAPPPFGADGRRQLVRRRRFAGGRRPGEHDDAPPAGEDLLRQGVDAVVVLTLTQIRQGLRLACRQRHQVTADKAFALHNVHKNPPRPVCGPVSRQSG